MTTINAKYYGKTVHANICGEFKSLTIDAEDNLVFVFSCSYPKNKKHLLSIYEEGENIKSGAFDSHWVDIERIMHGAEEWGTI